jgi:hypothetical protein
MTECPALADEPLVEIPVGAHVVRVPVDEACQVRARINEQVVPILVARREAWEAGQRAAGQVYYAHYWQHHSECKDEFFDPLEAARFLEYGVDRGDLGAVGVIMPDGTEVDAELLLLRAHGGVASWLT